MDAKEQFPPQDIQVFVRASEREVEFMVVPELVSRIIPVFVGPLKLTEIVIDCRDNIAILVVLNKIDE